MATNLARFILSSPSLPNIEASLSIGELARRALMSERFGSLNPPPEFSGRDNDGPLRHDEAHAHAFFLSEDADNDGLIDHLSIYCRTGFSHEALRRLSTLTRLWTTHEREELRLTLEGITEPELFYSSKLFGNAHSWTSVTPYLKNRFDKRRPNDFPALIESYRHQIIREWERRFPSTPPPNVTALVDPRNPTRFAVSMGANNTLRSPLDYIRTRNGRGGRQPDIVGGFFRLTFEHPTTGPIALGWGAHFGLGLFRRDD